MRTFLLLLIGLAGVGFPGFSQSDYRIFLNLNQVTNDRVKVVVYTPAVKEEIAEYVIPQVIPGSYSRKDFGRFIANFTAYSRSGKKLKVKKDGPNVFRISDAPELAHLEYEVDDTWDVGSDNNYIFQPGGTNIEAGKNFVINHHGFYGYLEGYKMNPYQVTIDKPNHLYGATALPVTHKTATQDVLTAPNYLLLADSPLMYSEPDTASFKSGTARIQVSVYSETGAVKASQVQTIITPLAQSLHNFFGELPVNNYHFIMYFPEASKSAINQFGGYGALEHSYSSFYFLPEIKETGELKEMILGVASHEFLHILTPLTLHSEEIETFDFRNPKMSAHLWLYEGVTEYFSNLVQVQNGLMTYDKFISEMRSKIKESQKFPEGSFTQMSRGVLEKKYQDAYGNVYQKGALIGFLLDIRLQELSNGQLSLQQILTQLSKKYGPAKPFKDDQLINEIVALSYPEISQFFKDYVEGSKPLPYAEYFEKLGLTYTDSKLVLRKTFGNMRVSYNDQQNLIWISSVAAENNVFGLQENDLLSSINGVTITPQNLRELLNPIVAEVKTDEEVSLTVVRNGKARTLKARPRQIEITERFVIEENPAAGPNQQKLRAKILKV